MMNGPQLPQLNFEVREIRPGITRLAMRLGPLACEVVLQTEQAIAIFKRAHDDLTENRSRIVVAGPINGSG